MHNHNEYSAQFSSPEYVEKYLKSVQGYSDRYFFGPTLEWISNEIGGGVFFKMLFEKIREQASAGISSLSFKSEIDCIGDNQLIFSDETKVECEIGISLLALKSMINKLGYRCSITQEKKTHPIEIHIDW
jgi:hypothetical protein